jgi:hypothetical protein
MLKDLDALPDKCKLLRQILVFNLYQLFARRELWLSLQFWESLGDKCTQQADVGVRLLV